MPNFWGLHHGITGYNELQNAVGKSFDFKATPYDKRMSVGDFVYLFWMQESLYGWGIIEKLTPDEDGLHQTVMVRVVRSQPGLASVPNQIKAQEIFRNWDSLLEEGCLSRFNDGQLRFLNSLLHPNSPPDSDTARGEAIPVPSQFRPVPDEFIRGRQLQIVETRFDEFKTVTSTNVVSAILKEVDDNVLAFLTLEDRRGEKFCRIFWGIADKPHTIVGITLQGGQPDEAKKAIVNKLSRIKPPLPKALFYVELHPVRDDNHQPIPDLYVLEVGVAEGEPDTIYCSESDKFYIRVENTVQELKGQELIAEVRRRERKLVRHIPKQDTPSFSLRFAKPNDYNRLRLKNDGTGAAKNIQIQDVPLSNTKFAGKAITFKTVPRLGPGEEAPLAFHYGGFPSIDAENASGIHQDPDVPQYLNKGTYTLKVFFTDLNDKRYIQELIMEGGHLTIGALREG